MTGPGFGCIFPAMPRIARIVLPNTPHLVAQRGNRGDRLFFSPDDRLRYLDILSEHLRPLRVKVWAYRLDPSEVLLLVVPRDGKSMGLALRNAHGRYSQLINRRQNTTGHLFQGRFYSCPLDADYLALAVRYAERFTGELPPAARSSARPHCRARRKGPSVLSYDLPLLKSVRNWRAWLREPVDKAALRHLLSRLGVGKPAGSPAFVKRVEGITGLNLSRGPGRPRTRPRGDA